MMTTTARFHRPGPHAVLKVDEKIIGSPGPGQVRLRHQAIGVNLSDAMFRQGAMPGNLLPVPGVEGAGVVEAVGPGVQLIKVGDRMAYFRSPGS